MNYHGMAWRTCAALLAACQARAQPVNELPSTVDERITDGAIRADLTVLQSLQALEQQQPVDTATRVLASSKRIRDDLWARAEAGGTRARRLAKRSKWPPRLTQRQRYAV